MRSKADVWTLADIPDQAGRTIVVTGPTVGGLGHHTALELARRGARVVLTGRTPEKLDATEQAIREEVATAELERLVVDLSDLESVRRGAAQAAELGPIHVLVNNAGVMATPYQRTADDLELQLATNHFGPFLLTGLLLPQLVASDGATVVAVSSVFHRMANAAPLGDPRQQRGPRSLGGHGWGDAHGRKAELEDQQDGEHPERAGYEARHPAIVRADPGPGRHLRRRRGLESGRAHVGSRCAQDPKNPLWIGIFVSRP